MVADSELRKPSSSTLEVHSLRPTDGTVIFSGKAGEQRMIKATEVFLILTGTKENTTEEEVTRSEMKFSLPGTMLTGGIPVWRRVKKKTLHGSVQVEHFVRLYDRVSLEPIVEISQHGFDYSFLGTKTVVSSFVNLNATVAELRKVFPQAAFDNRLQEHFSVDMAFAELGDEIEVNCKLIYLYYRAVSDIGFLKLAT